MFPEYGTSLSYFKILFSLTQKINLTQNLDKLKF